MIKKRRAACGVLLALVLGWGVAGTAATKNTLEGIAENDLHKFTSGYQWMYTLGGKWVPVLNRLPTILDNKTYIVLLQNNTELRSTGGFMGSYARIRFDKGGLTEMTVKDIYDPDGQLAGHVEPPAPIQEAFGQGWWRLRDANWDPDFTKAAETISWFFEQGNEKPADGIIAVNLTTIKKWIGVLGRIKPVTRQETIDEDNFYSIAQSEAETDWYPGSPQKRDFLGAVGTALIEESKSGGVFRQLKIAGLLLSEVKDKQILVWLKDKKMQQEIDKLGWSGKIEQPKEATDFLYIVENNLGANKANCCVQRWVDQKINSDEGTITMKWKNDNKVSVPDKVNNWGGDYIDYVRVIIPAGNKITGIKSGGIMLTEETVKVSSSAGIKEKNLQVFRVEKTGSLQTAGFWVLTKANEETAAEITYTHPGQNNREVIFVKRQPGIESFPYSLKVNGKIWEGIIGKDTVIRL